MGMVRRTHHTLQTLRSIHGQSLLCLVLCSVARLVHHSGGLQLGYKPSYKYLVTESHDPPKNLRYSKAEMLMTHSFIPFLGGVLRVD